MFFATTKHLEYKDILNNIDNIYAHTKKQGLSETLVEHSELTVKYFNKIIEVKHLDIVFNNFKEKFFKNCSNECVELWKEIIVNTVYLHDAGKSNPFFQKEKMKNNISTDYRKGDSKHSKFSSAIFYNYYINRLDNLNAREKEIILNFLGISSYIIDRHHSSLKSFNEVQNDIDITIREADEKIFKYLLNEMKYTKAKLSPMFYRLRKSIIDADYTLAVDLYIYSRFLYSILVASDYYATAEYMQGYEVTDFGVIDNVEDYYNCYKNTEISKAIEEYAKCRHTFRNSEQEKFKLLNALRSDIFLESEDNIKNNSHNDIFFLAAPTGAGKTNISINLALQLLQKDARLNKIYYTFPFNNLVEQTKNSLLDTFNANENITNNIAVVNSITGYKETLDDTGEIDFNKTYMAHQFLHYPITISTHVSLFNILFGIGKNNLFPLVHLANSVIILDEIQAYNNSIWKEIIVFLKAYSRLLNIKIVIMSATLPALDILCDEKDGFINLVKDSSLYFKNEVFKDRVKIDYSLINLPKEMVFKTICSQLKGNIQSINKRGRKAKILIEFIVKGTAIDFYNELKEHRDVYGLEDTEILLFTGEDNLIDRATIIKKIKEESKKDIVLIATQVVEAGVDIDMDIGYKDISMLDAEEQFLGRINRNNKKDGCVAYFFNYDDAKNIYKKDKRVFKEFTLLNSNMRDILENKEFDNYYINIMKAIIKDVTNTTERNYNLFIENNTINDLNFHEIKERMKLIEDTPVITLFVDHDIVYDNEVLNGKKIWEEYLSILNNKNILPSEKKVLLAKQNALVQNFTYEVRENCKNQFDYNSDLSINKIFFIDYNPDFFIDEKFSLKKLINNYFI